MTRTTWVRERLQARGLVHGPMRYPYADTPGRHHRRTSGGLLFPSVYPNWDNTPRLGRRGLVATGSTPERFGRQVRRAIELASANPAGEQVVVIKSWNEWAEGNYLEPDAEFGLGRLEALRAELARPRVRTLPRDPEPSSRPGLEEPEVDPLDLCGWPGRCRTWRCRPWPGGRAAPGARDRRPSARGRRPAGPDRPGARPVRSRRR